MRIDAINLVAFGPFDRQVVALPADRNLHLIYGANEAGKSTTLRAIAAAFFGIPQNQRDRWRHNDQVRTGLTISRDGESLEFIRFKGRKRTLRDADEKPLPDDALRPYLGRIDEDAFLTMFGLDHGQLRTGGQAIIEGKGDMGEALFAAGSGIANLRQFINTLQEEGDALYKERGVKPVINGLIAQYKEAENRMKQATVTSAAWKALEDAVADAERADAEARDALTKATEARLRNERLQEALPKLVERRELLAALEPLADSPRLSDDFASRRQEALHSLESARRALTEIAKRLAAIAEERESLPDQDGVLALGEEIEALHQETASYRTAKQDLEHEVLPDLEARERELARARETLASASTAGLEGALKAPAAERRQLARLAGAWASVEEKLRDTARRVASLEASLDRLDGQLSADAPPDPAPLQRWLKQMQQEAAQESDGRRFAAECERLQATLDAGAARLLPGVGGWDLLLETPLPGEKAIEAHRQTVAQWEEARRNAERDRQSAQSALDEARARQAEFEAAGDGIAPETLDEARADRDALLQEMLAAWTQGADADPAKHEALRHAVAQADAVADRLMAAAQQVEQLNHARRDVESKAAGLERTEAELARLTEQAQTLETAWAELWAAWPAVPAAPADVTDWLRNHAEFRSDVAEHGATKARLQAIDEALEARKRDTVALLAQHGHKVPKKTGASYALLTEALAQAVEDGAAAFTEHKARQQERAGIADTELPEARARAEEAAGQMAAWKEDWRQCTDALGLRADSPPEDMQFVIAALDLAAEAAGKAEGLTERRDKIRLFLASFEERVRELAERLAIDTASETPERVAQTLWKRLQDGREGAARRKTLAEDESRERGREREEQARVAEAEASLGTLCAEAGAAEPDALTAILEKTRERDRLEAKLAIVEEGLRSQAGHQGIDALAAELAAADPDRLKAEGLALAEREAECQAAEAEAKKRLAECVVQRNQADKKGEAAAAALDAESVAATLERRLAQYFRIKTAETALKAAIERYQEENEEPVLQQASAYFARLTGGAFQRLRPDYDATGKQRLLAERPDHGRVGVDGLSDGTADQLYLALRLASLGQFLRKHPPVPLIADDLFINFDDTRAAAGLQVLAEFSRQTQVVFFTHHRHLLDLAEKHLDKTAYSTQTLTD